MVYKSISLVLMSLFLTGQLFAQNSFPSSGDVGIGTTSPTANIEIVGSGTIGGAWNPSGSYLKIGNGGSGGMIFDTNEIYSSGGMFLGSSYSNHFYFRNVDGSGVENLMIIKNDGKMGIGTMNPHSKLHIWKGSSGSYYDQFATLLVEDTDGRLQILASDAGNNGASLSLTNNSKSWTFHQKTSAGGNNRLDIGYHQATSESNIAGVQDVKMSFLSNGRIGIGTLNPTEIFTVNGTAKAEEVIVEENIGADFVFEEDYHLLSLSELEKHIKINKHLPEIPSAQEMVTNGVKVGKLQMKLLQKIEELTLYVIEQNKVILKQQTHIEKLNKEFKNISKGH